MARQVLESHRLDRTGFRVFVDDDRILRVVDNPHFPRGETPEHPLTRVEANRLVESRWGFELDVIGEGDWVTVPNPDFGQPGEDDPTEVVFQGVVVGYDWRVRDEGWRDRVDVIWREDGQPRTFGAHRRLSGRERIPRGQRRGHAGMRIGLLRKRRRD